MNEKKIGFVNNWVIIAALIIIIAIIGGLIYYTYYFKSQDENLSGTGTSLNPPTTIEKVGSEIQLSETESQKPEPKSVVMKLSTDKNEYNLNDLINANVVINLSDKKTTGVDVFLKYDSSMLEIQKISPIGKLTKGGVLDPKSVIQTSASAFDTFPYLNVDILKGTAVFSALAKPQQYISGENQIVAGIAFKAIKKGNTSISFDFKNGLTTDTNVAGSSGDILDAVENAEIIIK